MPLECCLKNIRLLLLTNSYHPSTVIEWKVNMKYSYYKDKHDLGVYIISIKRELSQCMNVHHCPKWLLIEIEWFQFKDIL